MKISQDRPFQPITIVLESKEELDQLIHDLMKAGFQGNGLAAERPLQNVTYRLREALVGKQKAIV